MRGWICRCGQCYRGNNISSPLALHCMFLNASLVCPPPSIYLGPPAYAADIQGLRTSHKLIHPRSRRPSLIGLLGGLIGALMNWTGLGTLGSTRPILLLFTGRALRSLEQTRHQAYKTRLAQTSALLGVMHRNPLVFHELRHTTLRARHLLLCRIRLHAFTPIHTFETSEQWHPLWLGSYYDV